MLSSWQVNVISDVSNCFVYHERDCTWQLKQCQFHKIHFLREVEFGHILHEMSLDSEQNARYVTPSERLVVNLQKVCTRTCSLNISFLC